MLSLLCLVGILFAFQAKLNVEQTEPTYPKYLVVNIVHGTYRYTDDDPDVDDDTCRTDELWLRYIPAGQFTMGSQEDEPDYNDSENLHKVELTQPFYIGVFECTQYQWAAVIDSTDERILYPSWFRNEAYCETRPVERVSYLMIRGGNWPEDDDVIDKDSFMGILQNRTGMMFDLPTEAQWEYACRAGTTTALNSGDDLDNAEIDDKMAVVGRYMGNSNYKEFNENDTASQEWGLEMGTAKVGSYDANAWGLYDMHGNVLEWCRDWNFSNPYYSGTDDNPVVKDPVGEYFYDPENLAEARAVRGGGWCSPASGCRSAYRGASEAYVTERDHGFRIVCLTMPDPEQLHTLTVTNGTTHKAKVYAGETVTITADNPPVGKVFDKWTSEDEDVTFIDPTDATTTFDMPDKAVTVTATYKDAPKYQVTVVNGTADMAEAAEGETVTITADEPPSGKVFDCWTGSVLVANATATETTFVMPANDVTMTANYMSGGTRYLVIYDLDKEKWQYRYTDSGPDLTNDACRTMELWLRYIPEGEFMMGSPEDEVGRNNVEVQHKVTLTKPFYIGVFECTQQQWEYVMGKGNRPSYFRNDDCYATRPVEYVSYDEIRGEFAGAGWPTKGHAVDATSFMGVLRDKTGLMFDLPTEAQWEYACRAGTTTALNSGKNLTSSGEDANVAEVDRYWYNGGSAGVDQPYCGTAAGTAKVGSYLPNNWGLYDMHGNVSEWCLDWWDGMTAYSSSDATDPVGDASGLGRMTRGGGNNSCGYAYDCRSASRVFNVSEMHTRDIGFRVVFLPPETYAVTVANGTADKTEAAVGETVTITANDQTADHLLFNKWTGDVTFADATATETTFVMPAKAVTVTATYKDEPKYRVTVKNGTADKTEAYAGETITITANDPAEHHQFDSWTGAVDFVDATATETTFVMPGNAVTVTATYLEDPKYTVTVVGGKASKTMAYEGDVIKVTANKPASSQAFDAWTGDVDFADATATPTTFTMPAKAVKVTATFKTMPKTYRIVVVNGKADKEKAAVGEIVTLTANTPPAGKVFDKWTGGATFDDPNSPTTTFAMPAKAVTPKAIYKKK